MSDATLVSPANAGKLVSLEEAAALIRSGKVLSIAADAALLEQLPPGNWIGGTIPYFMAQDGGETTREKVFVTQIDAAAGTPTIRYYDTAELSRVCVDAPESGFSLIILPAFSESHSHFARDAPSFPDMYMKPLAGWIAGIHLDDLGNDKPLVFSGNDAKGHEEGAVVMHVTLPPERIAQIGIINLFKQGTGDKIRFTTSGFSAEGCLINGKPTNFAEYVKANQLDTRLPLVADYCGAMINVSIKEVDEQAGRVDFYAPVFDDVEYRIAAPVTDYVEAFRSAAPQQCGQIAFCCNCILNYLYSELEGKRVERMFGPMTFGEVAYQLLNQTLVYVTIED